MSIQLGKAWLKAMTLSSVALAELLQTAQADQLLEPFASANRNPFVQVYGLPTSHSAYLVAPGQYQFNLQLEAANSFTSNTVGSERILIDGESYRANIQFAAGLSEQLEVGVNIPYLSHDGGSLDGFIESWHDVFGFPDGGRPQYPKDRLRYAYWHQGELILDVDQPVEGIGDISLSAGYQLSTSATRQWTLRGQLKLPTADAGELLGSESTDVALALHVSDRSWRESSRVELHGSLGLLWMDNGEVLQPWREDWVIYGSATLGWQATADVGLKLQLDSHTAFYDSALTELGDDSAQLVLGGTVRLSPGWLLDLAVSEDIAVDTAPDVVFHIGIRAGEF